jgi:hypothetical protein
VSICVTLDEGVGHNIRQEEGHNNQNSKYLTSKSWPKEFYFATDTIYVCYEYFF